MDESILEVPARVTRSHRASVESPASPARKTRTRKLKNINEKEESVGERRNSVDDCDDAASNASSSSVKSCHVVLRRENFDSNNANTEDRSVADSTRARRSSQLTEENISAAYSNAPQRSLRSGSVISGGTESTRRSTRLAQSQNTPKKESATQPSTPARRSSRLLSETAAESPAKNTSAKITPARRNTRNSVISIASEDNSPPPSTRRASSRLVEYGTPKSLKTKATKIKVEPTTPRRASMRINKSIIATEIIDEETDEDEIATENANKSKKATKFSENLIIELDDEENKIDVEMKVIESNTSKDGNKSKAEADDDDEPIVIDDPVDVKPVLTEEQKSANKETVTSSSDLIEALRADASIKSPISKTPSMSMSPVVLISTTTSHSPKLNTSLPKGQTPTVEPSEPMEMSMTEAQIEPTGTPKGKAQNVIESSNTPHINLPKTKTMASDLDSMDMNAIFDESILSTTPSKSTEGCQKSNVSAADTTQMESEGIEIDKPDDNNQSIEAINANVSRVEPESTNDLEEMEVDTEAAPEAEHNEVNEKVIVSNKPLENIKRSESSTPKSKASATAANDWFDVSPLAQADEDSTSTPQSSKKSSKRQSLNDTVQSTGFDQMEVTILADESTKKTKKSKSATPQKMDSSNAEDLPKSPVSFEKANTSKSSAKTPQKEKSVDQDDEDMFDKTSDTPKVQTPKLLRPPRESTFGIVSKSLREELDNLVSTLYTPDITTKQNDRSMVEIKAPIAIKEIDRQIDEIADAITPSDPEVIDRHFEEIATKSMPDEPQAGDAVQEGLCENMNDTTSSKDKELSIIEQKDVSKKNDSQSESNSTTSTEVPPQKETASIPKSQRKSVQIMTPVGDKNQKMAMKRIDTPYPDDKSITEATSAANRSKSDEGLKKRELLRAEARDHLKKLSESWNESVKRNSLSNESPKPIDKLGVADTAKAEEKPAKKAVPARNNWSHLVDSESEPEQDELVLETDEGESQGEEGEETENEFVDDEVEVVENYESGDSMDEEEKREIEENDIETGLDIGSEDTENEDEEDDDEYEDDGFIVSEVDETDASNTESEEEEEGEEHFVVGKKPARRSSRIIQPSSSEDESDDNANENEIISVSVELVPESVIVIHGNSTEAEELVEGKTFPTTYFTPVDDDEKSTKAAKATELSEKSDVTGTNRTLNEEKPTEEICQENDVSAKSIEPSTSANANESMHEDQNEIASEIASEMVDQPAESDKVEEMKESDTEKIDSTLQATASAPAVESDAKENRTVPKKIKHRTSLPGIERLAKSSIVKKNSRLSLGNLDPNTQTVSISSLKTQSIKANTTEKAQSKNKNRVNMETSIQKDETSTVNVILRSDDSKNASLNTSAPEENNNNEKTSKKGKADIQSQNDENILTESVVEINTATSTSESVTATSKSKRKFNELDICEEVQQRSLKPRKLLRIINSASGQFIEEPMTPEKNKKFGFKEIPRTPTNHSFKVEKRVRVPVPYQPRKRKSIYLNDDEDVDLLLPQPKWRINTQFEESQPKKRARKLDLGSTEVIIASAVPTKKKNQFYLVPAELARYRQNILYRASIPRQNSRALLRERQKQMTYK